MIDQPQNANSPTAEGPAGALGENAIPSVSWSTDLDLCVTSVSGTEFPLTEDVRRRVAGRAVAAILAEDLLPMTPMEAHERALSGEVSTCHLRWRGREFQSHAGPLYDGSGRIVGVSGFSQDISLQRCAERALRESEVRYQAISELTSTYAYSAFLEPGGHLFVEWVTGDFIHITGYTLEEIKQLGGPLKLTHPADRPIAERRTERLLAGEPHVSEFRIVTKAGETRWLRDYGRPVRDDTQKRTIRIFGTAQDITDRKQAELALRESEERFRLVFEESPLGMVTLDEDGVFLQANRALAQMLGYAPAELVGRRMADLAHPDDVAPSMARLADVAAGKVTRATWEKRCLGSEGQVVWGRVTATALHDHDGHMLCILCMIEDITERKHTEQALRRAERLASIGTLAAGIAHELNNPLGAITLSVDAVTLSEEQPDREEILRVALENIHASASRCGRIVKSVLQFARDDASQKAPGDLADVVRHAGDMARSFAARHEVSIRLDVSDTLPPVVMNATEMGQVVVNLLFNAIQASRPGDCVTVTTASRESTVYVSVEDQGCGMTEGQIDRMFDPFYTSRADEGGTGLGLSITYGIVRQHEGTIDVRSRPGQGTTVTIALPAATATS